MNEIPKAVFTKKGFAGIQPSADQSPAAASWAEARVFDGNLALPLHLKLVDVKAFPGGIVAQTYRI